MLDENYSNANEMLESRIQLMVIFVVLAKVLLIKVEITDSSSQFQFVYNCHFKIANRRSNKSNVKEQKNATFKNDKISLSNSQNSIYMRL